MRKKKKDKRKFIFLLALLIVILISLAVMINDDRKLNIVEKFIKDSTLSISNFISKPFYLLKSNFFQDDVFNYNKNIESIEHIGINEEIIKENEELKKLLELNNTLSERSYINATVINRNIGFWFDELTVDKGSNDGVLENMAVISSNGLIGKTIKVSNNNSVIKLLTNENMDNKISVKIEFEDKFIYGLLSSFKDGYFIVDGISNNFEISNGAMVVTSGLSDLFPSGILIGYVEDISSDNFDLVKTLKVKSDIDFNDIYYVTILKRNVDNTDD